MNLRLDRLVTLYIASPSLKLLSGRNQSVPILMYHSITDKDETNRHPYYRTTTTPAMFAAHLKYLQEQGYSSCSLAYALRHLQSETSARAKLVAITFDDGYSDFFRHGFPLLQQHRFNATVFLPSAYIGDHPISFKGKDCLTWAEVRDLNRNGILFGSHTVTHPQLRELSVLAIQDEVMNSRQTIEQRLGCAVESFAYPYAFPQADADFKKVLRDLLLGAGYRNGVCTVVGRANPHSDPLFLERLPANSSDDNRLLGAKLDGAYDWISQTQHISKIVRTGLGGSKRNAKRLVSKDFPRVQSPL